MHRYDAGAAGMADVGYPDEVISLVSSMLARRESSFLYRIGNNVWRLYLRGLARDLWCSLEKELLVLSTRGFDP
ncbi:hypothetical protein [Paraburkholderia tropica]|uniref:hypothetical protein n=1 Tax=Paraburkholderia tropica TaxID=92647 RepID=UPI001F2FBB68|nr:hypothetical protein [Paraburkholderia tropica]